ncbi:MAG: hypothetical protein AAF696_33355 [Bacteroidota bacterium]
MKKISFFSISILFLFISVMYITSCEEEVLENVNENLPQSAQHQKDVRSLINPYDDIGMSHNYYCRDIINNTSILNYPQSFSVTLGLLENYFYHESGEKVNLGFLADPNGELADFSYDNNPLLTEREKTFLDDMFDQTSAFDWRQSNPVPAWNSMMDGIVKNGLAKGFAHEEVVLSSASIAQHSGILWYGEFTDGGSNPAALGDPNWLCIGVAVLSDAGSMLTAINQGGGFDGVGTDDVFAAVGASVEGYFGCL